MVLHGTAVSSMAAALDCGQPKSAGVKPTASDALFVLKTAVGSGDCDLCLCDINNDQQIAASDALFTLRAAVGQPVAMDCPACASTTIFISSLSYDGNLGGLAGADAKCQQLANAAILDGTYAAWLSSASSDARYRFAGTASPFRLVDGTLVAGTFNDLVSGTLAAPINRTESGADLDSRAWTGTAPSGLACFQGSGGTCNLVFPGLGFPDRLACKDWSAAEEFSEAVTGVAATDGSWTLEGDRSCTDQHRLYCIEQTTCATTDDCGLTGTACRLVTCSDESSLCGSVPAATGTDCTSDGVPLKDVCADDTSAAAGTCVECNSDEECTVIPDGAFDVTCFNHVCEGSVHGSQAFGFTGAQANFIVPPGITSLKITADGAPGAKNGAPGGSVTATVAVTPGEHLAIFVGGSGGADYDEQGGYNGGGFGGSAAAGGGGGGGASDVRQGGTALENRIAVAAGGGGDAAGLENPPAGGAGGGLVGSSGDGPENFPGSGGTQAAGGTGSAWPQGCTGFPGSLGIGGNASQGIGCSIWGGGGGGGGGYYGGGGGGGAEGDPKSGFEVGGGGGGSSYALPSATDVTHTAGFSEQGHVLLEW